MMNRLLILVLLIISCNTITGQNISGVVLNATNKQPVEFVNIGIVGKNVGTVTDLNGKFNFFAGSEFANDTILFSMIGYNPLLVKIADLNKNAGNEVLLEEKTYEIAEVIIKPKKIKQQTLGVTTKFKKIAAGFKDNLLGYECGILINVKKTAFIKKVNINISVCSYDTIFYRLNIYKVRGTMDFENILREPIYIKMPKESVKDEIQIDLQSRNIVVDGDFLITLEHIKDLGNGYLHFCAGLTEKTYYRKTSQGKWETVPVGISISVIADVEK
ncbi:MAG TPA: hypothetical protein DCQ24_03700 [Bacteroidales bacterium]|nr:hypothetical protein [Bacteroidales bacterium]